MENEYTDASLQSPTVLIITPQIENFLKETVKWGKLLAVLGYVLTVVIALLGISFMIGFPLLNETNGVSKLTGFAMGCFYLLLSLIYFFPSRYLYSFCSNVASAFVFSDQQSLTLGFENLKSNFKFWGITAMIMIAFYVIMILAALVIAGIFMAR